MDISGAAAVVVAAVTAAAPAPTGAALGDWIRRNTDLPPAQVVIAGPEQVYSLEPLGTPTSTGEVIALVRTEPVGEPPDASGFVSWEAHLLFDCSNGRVRQIRSVAFTERNRNGQAVPDAPRDGWITPEPDQPVAQLMSAACDPDFTWPLRTVAAAPQLVPPVASPRPAVSGAGPEYLPDLRPARAAAPPAAVAAVAKPLAPVATPIPAPAAPAAPLPTPATGASAAVQVARGPSEAGANQALAAARKALGPLADGVAATVVKSEWRGRARYTARLTGFSSAEAASDVCAKLTAARQACLVVAATSPADEPAPAAGSPPPQAAPAAPSGYRVQVARGPSQAGAKKALVEARRALGPLAEGLTEATELSQLSGGRRRYTALLTGFATPEAAAEACARLTGAGQACLTPPPARR